MKDRSLTERLAVIEEIVERTEQKLDTHILSADKRISRLERAWAYATGAFTIVLGGLAIYVKTIFRP
jgi:uncharacterized protein YerC